MFEVYKKEIVRGIYYERKKRLNWPKVIVHNRYETLGTGIHLLLLLTQTTQGLTIKELSGYLNKHCKTIRRLLAVLDEIGIPIIEINDPDLETHGNHRYRYKIIEGWAKNIKI